MAPRKLPKLTKEQWEQRKRARKTIAQMGNPFALYEEEHGWVFATEELKRAAENFVFFVGEINSDYPNVGISSGESRSAITAYVLHLINTLPSLQPVLIPHYRPPRSAR